MTDSVSVAFHTVLGASGIRVYKFFLLSCVISLSIGTTFTHCNFASYSVLARFFVLVVIAVNSSLESQRILCFPVLSQSWKDSPTSGQYSLASPKYSWSYYIVVVIVFSC